jgi:hypothetical protein
MAVVITAMAPKVSSVSIVHGAATAQRELAAAHRANRRRWRRVIGYDLFAIGCLCYFHDSLGCSCSTLTKDVFSTYRILYSHGRHWRQGLILSHQGIYSLTDFSGNIHGKRLYLCNKTWPINRLDRCNNVF